MELKPINIYRIILTFLVIGIVLINPESAGRTAGFALFGWLLWEAAGYKRQEEKFGERLSLVRGAFIVIILLTGVFGGRFGESISILMQVAWVAYELFWKNEANKDKKEIKK
jgi:hypothetical protein